MISYCLVQTKRVSRCFVRGALCRILFIFRNLDPLFVVVLVGSDEFRTNEVGVRDYKQNDTEKQKPWSVGDL